MTDYNAGDEEKVVDAEKREKNARLQHIEDIRAILKLPSGIRFFKWFMDEGKVFTHSFTGNSWTYFNEGRRDLALKVFHDIVEAKPSIVKTLLIREEDDED